MCASKKRWDKAGGWLMKALFRRRPVFPLDDPDRWGFGAPDDRMDMYVHFHRNGLK